MALTAQFSALFERSLQAYCEERSLNPTQLSDQQWYQLVAQVAHQAALQFFPKNAPLVDTRKVNYLSMEFLVGRLLGNNLQNLGVYQYVVDEVAKYGKTLVDILEQETDPAFGNGGLGRLAACYLDSMASLAQPAVGYGLHYQYGLFKQSFDWAADNMKKAMRGDVISSRYSHTVRISANKSALPAKFIILPAINTNGNRHGQFTVKRLIYR
ncbi:glucan phosphorylase [Actinobacillus equuli]|nr:glucan phosphorylase [Actinobacillus equuli]